MLAQGDVAAVAGAGLLNTHVATFVLVVWVTFLVCLLLPTDLADADGEDQEGERQYLANSHCLRGNLDLYFVCLIDIKWLQEYLKVRCKDFTRAENDFFSTCE